MKIFFILNGHFFFSEKNIQFGVYKIAYDKFVVESKIPVLKCI
jgi:hypothetical protein